MPKTRALHGRHVNAWPVVAVAALAAAAGCGQAAPVPAGVPIGEDGAALPTVHGTVVDAAIKPVEGVRVSLLASKVNATTDAQGMYAIYRPTPAAETILVTAHKPGYTSMTQSITVSAQRSEIANFRLQEDPFAKPYSTVLKFRGQLGCQASLDAGVAPQRVSCQVNLNFGGDPVPPNRWDIFTDPNLAGAVVQVAWQAASAGTETLEATLEGPAVGGHDGAIVGRATGPSQLRLELPYVTAKEAFTNWSGLRLWVNATAAPTGPVPGIGVSATQTFDAYATLFYVDPPPEGYVLG